MNISDTNTPCIVLCGPHRGLFVTELGPFSARRSVLESVCFRTVAREFILISHHTKLINLQPKKTPNKGRAHFHTRTLNLNLNLNLTHALSNYTRTIIPTHTINFASQLARSGTLNFTSPRTPQSLPWQRWPPPPTSPRLAVPSPPAGT